MLHPVETEYTQNIYDYIGQNVISSLVPGVVWWNRPYKGWANFVKMLQVYTGMTTTLLKASIVVNYQPHTIRMNFTKRFCRFLIDHEYTLIVLLPVSTSGIKNDEEFAPLVDKNVVDAIYDVLLLSRVTQDASAKQDRQMKFQVIYKSMWSVIVGLPGDRFRGFALNVAGMTWACSSTNISYRCNILEGKDLSVVKHGVTSWPFVCCLIRGYDIELLNSGNARTEMGADRIHSTYRNFKV